MSTNKNYLMNQKDIEEATVSAVASYLRPDPYLRTEFHTNDKFILWDGFIHRYSSVNQKKDNLSYSILTQIRGTGKVMKDSGKVFRLDRDELKNYFKSGGLCFFGGIVGADYKTDLYYSFLTPRKLRSILYAMASRGNRSTYIQVEHVPENCEKFREKLDAFYETCELEKRYFISEIEPHIFHEEVKKQVSTYIETEFYRQAKKFWETEHVLILSGEAGCGKTAMAYYLAWNYIEGNIEENVEKIVCTQTVDAAFAQFDENKKQVFIWMISGEV